MLALSDQIFSSSQHFERMLLDDGERYRLEYLVIRLLKVLTRNRLVRYVKEFQKNMLHVMHIQRTKEDL